MKSFFRYSEIILSVIFLFFILWYCTENIMEAFIKTFFIEGMFIFNFAVCYTYYFFKVNHWNVYLAIKEYDWKFYLGGALFVIILFPIVMPKYLLVYWIVMSVILWIVLFLYDIIKNGWHSH